VVYKPFNFFFSLGLFLFLLGLIPGIRFVYFIFAGQHSGHVQSLILSAILLITGVQFFVLAFLGDLLAVNRKLLEDIQYRMRKLQADGVVPPERKKK